MSSFSENWKRVNNNPVCFGARGDSYGAFNIIESGLIYTFKLAHLNGNIRCSEEVAASYWGCTHDSYGDKQLGTIITFKNKTALQLAEYRGDGIGCAYYSYKLDGVGVNAPILAFNNSHLHWPCLRDKNSEYGLEGTCITVARAITAGRRVLMFLRGMRELVFCIVKCWSRKHCANKLYF